MMQVKSKNQNNIAMKVLLNVEALVAAPPKAKASCGDRKLQSLVLAKPANCLGTKISHEASASVIPEAATSAACWQQFWQN